ncbi:MAG TPA: Plug domain-containing protein [Gemmatimonadales bacterium]|nr:Plug domain-containing protein [Gemmatimonadales bacterium]
MSCGVRRIGYRAQYLTATLAAGDHKEVTIALTPGVYELPEVAVTARLAKPIEYAWTTKYDEFFRRKLVGLGRYISRQDIDKKAAAHTVELLLGVPGVRVYLGMPGVSPDRVKFNGCAGQLSVPQVSVWIDGWELHPTASSPEEVAELLERVNPLTIEMMEVYTGPARMQAEFRGNTCATIAIWTR